MMIDVLGGSIEYIDHMGSDVTVLNCAKVSFNKEVEEVDEKGEKLFTYLAKHGHWSPFSHPQVSVRINAPISVQRQWEKHKVGVSNNSESTRYVTMIPRFYIPQNYRSQSENNKQGSDGYIEEYKNDNCKDSVNAYYEHALTMYDYLIANGVAREQARDVLPLSTYTTWISTMSLYAAFNIYKLRTGHGAQPEIGDYARALEEIVEPLFPIAWSSLKNA